MKVLSMMMWLANGGFRMDSEVVSRRLSKEEVVYLEAELEGGTRG